MKIVQVIYTTTLEYSEQNKKNIHEVMESLKSEEFAGIRYHVCLSSNNKTFIHTAFFKSDNDQNLLNALVPFKQFQSQLKENGFEVPPKQDLLSFVGSSFPIFNSI